MKNTIFIFFFIFSILQSDSYSWEDGGTILGSFGNLSSATNVDEVLVLTEDPIDGTPSAYIAAVSDLTGGESIEVCVDMHTPDTDVKGRIWGHYYDGVDITSYDGSASGPSDYADTYGDWEQSCYTWTVDSGKVGFILEARLYSYNDGSPLSVDNLLLNASSGTVIFPSGSDGQLGCTDESSCNYDSNATVNDGSCLYNDCLGECGGDAVEDCLGECGGTAQIDTCGVCGGDDSTCDSVSLFFSEYAEGSSNNKYLEIYNPGIESVSLSGYAFPSVGNAPTTPGEYEYWNTFDEGAIIAPGDVYVICHGSADDTIQTECDQEHTYLSNGNDGMCLIFGTESNYTILDCIGDWNGDPGSGWSVAGVSNGTQDHTLVRKSAITEGTSDWSASAGTNTDDSEWSVLDIDTWNYIGSHPHDFTVLGCTDPYAGNYNPDANVDDGSCDYSAPVANAGEDQSVDFGTTVTLSGNGYVNDGQIIGYLWSQTGGPNVTLSDYEEQTVTFTAPDEFCTLTFSLQVIDSNANFSSLDEVSIFVGSYSIHDVQFTEEQGTYCYETEASEESVTVTGVVTHVKPGDSPNFFIQDPDENELWSGIYIYDTTVNPSVGDELTVTATVNEYYSLTQLIDVTAFSLISSGNNIDPLLINASDLGIECSFSGEQYESMLVGIEDVTFDSVDEFGNWMVSDVSGTTMVDDYYYDGTFPSINAGDTYDCITGIVSYSYSEFKIYPRNINDFSCYATSCNSNGDVNADNSLDVLDIVIIVSSIVNLADLSNDEQCAADINGDGSIDVLDIVTIVQIIVS